jgi:FtsH ternary system domain X6
MSRDMILVARALVREGPYDAIERILLGPGAAISGLTMSEMRTFEDALAKGCVHALARHGGSRMLLRSGPGGEPVEARLWRCATPKLVFSPFAFELCRWLVTEPLGGGARLSRFDRKPQTIADELIAYLACGLIEGTPVESAVGLQPGLRASSLGRLGFTRLLMSGTDKGGDAPVFDALVQDGVVVEGLALDLARRAAKFERELARVSEPAKLLALGKARETTLDGFVDACIAARRIELATFLVDAASDAMKVEHVALDRLAPLRERLEARRASGAYLRVLGKLGREHQKARHVSYIDEAYATAQLVLTRWEHLGSDGFARATSALSDIESWNGG